MKSPGKNAPLHKHVEWFVKRHLGKDAFAPFTGQDRPAWIAFVYLVECWTKGGGNDAVIAMRSAVRCVQPIRAVFETFIQAIPAVGDWSHVADLWPRIAGRSMPSLELVLRGDQAERSFDVRELYAIERSSAVGRADHITKYGWSRHMAPVASTGAP